MASEGDWAIFENEDLMMNDNKLSILIGNTTYRTDYLDQELLKKITFDLYLNSISSQENKTKIIETIGQYNKVNEWVYENADDFRQGSCQLFALALHHIFGYSSYIINEDSSNHYFCKKSCGGTTYYIDVRGITTDFNRFSESLSFLHPKLDTSTIYRIEDEMPDEKIHLIGLGFARWIIKTNPVLYKI